MQERESTAASRLVVGVDLGGTKTEIALVAADGQVTAVERYATEVDRGPDELLERVGVVIRRLARDAGPDAVLGVGVGVAGQVDPSEGAVWYAPNLRWRRVGVRAALETAAGLPVAVLNDVQAATVGEARFGVGWDYDDLVCVFVGTGVGGGVVSGGRLLTGCTGSAGELGHMTIDLHGPSCRCGNRGCLEAYVGGWAIAQRARDAMAGGGARGEGLRERVAGELDAITADVVAGAAEDGDPLATALMDETVEALAAGAATIVNGFNPCLLVLGGGVIEGVPTLVDRVRDRVRTRALDAATRALDIRPPALGRHAGVVGAASWARAAFRD